MYSNRREYVHHPPDPWLSKLTGDTEATGDEKS